MAWFRITFAEKAFLRILGNHDWSLDTLTVEQGVEAMLEFYREHRAQHTNLAADGDLLRLRWDTGIVEVTRQLVRSESPDTPIRQLSLSFQVDAALPTAGTHWFSDPAGEIDVPSFFGGVPIATRLTFDEV